MFVTFIWLVVVGWELFLAGCGWVWVGMHDFSFGWVWVGVDGYDLFSLGMGDCGWLWVSVASFAECG